MRACCFFFTAMELLALFIVKKRRTVAKKIPVVNSLLNEDEGSSEKKIGRFQPIKVEYELVEYETAGVRNDRNLVKVRHSQRINDSLISCWVITEERWNDCVSSLLRLQSWSGRILFACSKRTSSSFFTNSHRSNGFLPMLRELNKYSNSSVCAPASNVVVFSLCPHFLQS